MTVGGTMGYQLGVDLGTTFTAAAVANGQPPTMLGLGNRSMQVPSVLFLQSDGTFLVGEPAERRGAVEPYRVAREFKRRIGDPVPILIAGSSHSPQSLTAHLLRWVVDTATLQMGEAPESVTITHPAAWTGYRHELFEEVIALAGIGAARSCSEPLAAAVQYSSHTRVPVGAKVAVYDLGGGTFDVCLLEKTEQGFQVLGSPKGIEYLGGVDFDELLFQQVFANLENRLGDLDPDSPEATAGITRLRRDCVEAKEALSSDVETVIPVSLPGLSTSVRLTRSEMEALIRPALMRTVEAMGRALQSAEVKPRDLNAIVLVGGSSRIPLVTEILSSAFETPTALDTHPKHDVALGAVQVFASPGDVTSGVAPPPPTATHRLALQRRTRRRRDDVAGAAPVSAHDGSAQPPAHQPAGLQAPATTQTSSRASNHASDTTPPPSPDAAREVLPTSSRRRLATIGAALAGLVVVATIGIVYATAGPGDTPSGSGGPIATAAGSAPAAATTADVSVPESAALGENMMLIPMRVDGNWDIYLADATSGSPVRRITSDPGQDLLPVLSPRRRTVAYLHDSVGGERSIVLAAAADGSGARPLWTTTPSQCAGAIYRPAWDPRNEDRIAVACQDAQDDYGLYLFDLSGQLIRQYEVGQERIADPAFSHDGSLIAYWASPASSFDGGEIFTLSSDGTGRPQQLTTAELAGQDADPVWSPSDDSIVFRRRVPDGTTGGNYDLYRINRDGTGLRVLVTAESDDQDPTFSPFGDRIAFKSNRANDSGSRQQDQARIWIATSKGTDPRPLWTAADMGEQSAPAWTFR